MSKRKTSAHEKRMRFASEYVVDLNATQAAIRAGYAERSAPTCGPRLLHHVEVKAEISRLIAARSEETGITAARVLREMAIVGFSDIGDILDFSGEQPKLRAANQISPEARRSISAIKIKKQLDGVGEAANMVEIIEFRLWDKNASLLQMGKHTGVVVDKTKVEGGLTMKIVEELVDSRATNDDPAAPGAK